MIKPPAMGVFARDAPPSSSSSSGSANNGTNSGNSANNGKSGAKPVPDTAKFDFAASGTSATDRSRPERGDEMPADEDTQDDDQGTVDEEAGIIRCICGCDDDDGFTIQCDRCLVWQHCACFGMSQASVPDEYLCEQCEPRPVDVAFAVAHQQKRRNNEARKALMDRNLKRQAQALVSASYTHDYLAKEAASTNAVAANTNANLNTNTNAAAMSTPAASSPALHFPTLDNGLGDEPATLPPVSSYSNSRSRKPSQALDLSNTQFVVPDVPASAGSNGRSAKQRKGQKGSRRGPETPTAASTPGRGTYTPGSTHERSEDPFDAADQLEAWHVEFTPISRNVVADPEILPSLAAAMLDWEDGSPIKATSGLQGRMVAPVLPKSITAAILRGNDAAMDEDLASGGPAGQAPVSAVPAGLHSLSSASSSPYRLASPTSASHSLGLSAVGGECVPVEMSGSSLTDLAARTYVRHISETASAGVFSNVLQLSNASDEPQRAWSASKAFSRPVMHGLFADTPIPAGAFIAEYRGELYSADAYRNDPINQFAALGATKPHVHLLPPPLNVAIDARRFGNEARFARFSCHPNAVLRPILFRRSATPVTRSLAGSRAHSPATFHLGKLRTDTPPADSRRVGVNSSSSNNNTDHPGNHDGFVATEAVTTSGAGVSVNADEPELLFGLFAIADISRTHEITLGWEWDDAHIVHFLPELVQNPYMESEDPFDADRHTANLVAIAEKGDFPYVETEFSSKMSSVSTALLGCVMCACIGSAAPPGGGGGASANNGRKQDCAVAQMLRVGCGMSLLNVTMPGKSNRRAKLPDFTPLVGVRRQWRPVGLPPTPDSSTKGYGSDPTEADGEILLGGSALDVQDVLAMDDVDTQDEDDDSGGQAGCGSMALVVNRASAVQDDVDMDHVSSAASDLHTDDSSHDDHDHDNDDGDDDDDDDAASVASSLTDPLSGLSDQEVTSDEEDVDLAQALRMADVSASKATSGTDAARHSSNQDSGLFLLPPKKRSMRTRIKATMSPSLSEMDEDNDDDDDDDDHRSDSRKSANVPSGNRTASHFSKSRKQRKPSSVASRLKLDFDSSEDDNDDDNDERDVDCKDVGIKDDDGDVSRNGRKKRAESRDDDGRTGTPPPKKRRKAGNIADPSSPLSSVPSPGGSDSSLSSPPTLQRASAKLKAKVKTTKKGERVSEVELSKQRRAARRGQDGSPRPGLKSTTPRESASKRKKREEARKLRKSILDMGDTESSDEAWERNDVSMDADRQTPRSGASTPVKQQAKKLADEGNSTPSASSSPTMRKKQIGTTGITADTDKKQKATTVKSSQVESRDQSPSAVLSALVKKEMQEKIKKSRRIVSDTDSSAEEDDTLTAAEEDADRDGIIAATPKSKSPGVVQSEPDSVTSSDSKAADAATAPVTTTAAALVVVPPHETATTATTSTPSVASALADIPTASLVDVSGKPPTEHAALTTESVTVQEKTKEEEAKQRAKKEEPTRVKLSLAEYKRRLAERRISEQQAPQADTAAALSSPLDTPMSELPPTTPAVERRDPVQIATVTDSPAPSAPVSPSKGSAPTSVLINVDSTASQVTPVSSEPSTCAANASRSILFTSISAPTAIRSVEIPRSPSPEPGMLSASHDTVAGAGDTSFDAATAATVSTPSARDFAAAAVPTESISNDKAAAEAVSSVTQSAGPATADAPSLLTRLEARRGPSSAAVDDTRTIESGSKAAPASSLTSDGFVKPADAPTLTSSIPAQRTTQSPVPSPSNVGTTGSISQRPPSSPSSSVGSFNPPKAPRAFLGSGSGAQPSPSAMPTGANAITSSTPASSSSVITAASPTGVAAAATVAPPQSGYGHFSTPTRSLSISGAAAAAAAAASASGNSNAAQPPSAGATRQGAQETGSSGSGGAGLSPPSPAASAFLGGPGPRDYAGVPRGPASMRDVDHPPGAAAGSGFGRDAWAEAREHREFAASRDGRDHGWGDRDAHRPRWDRDRDRDSLLHRSAVGGSGSGSLERDYLRDRDRDPAAVSGGAGLSGRGDPHVGPHSYGHGHGAANPYRRASMADYDDPMAGPPISPYDRASDPYNRGIVVRGRSLGMGGPAGGAGGGPAPTSSASGPLGRDVREHRDPRTVRDYGDFRDMREPRDPRDLRDYDDLAGGNGPGGVGSGVPVSGRGGFRGGWGGGGRGRGRGGSGRGRGGGHWMR